MSAARCIHDRRWWLNMAADLFAAAAAGGTLASIIEDLHVRHRARTLSITIGSRLCHAAKLSAPRLRHTPSPLFLRTFTHGRTHGPRTHSLPILDLPSHAHSHPRSPTAICSLTYHQPLGTPTPPGLRDLVTKSRDHWPSATDPDPCRRTGVGCDDRLTTCPAVLASLLAGSLASRLSVPAVQPVAEQGETALRRRAEQAHRCWSRRAGASGGPRLASELRGEGGESVHGDPCRAAKCGDNALGDASGRWNWRAKWSGPGRSREMCVEDRPATSGCRVRAALHGVMPVVSARIVRWRTQI
jgi:hypothetical protein